jgi:hypothetical protein
LIARDGGCTKPSCTVPAYGTQVHHAALDWTYGGLTNVNHMALACGPDNRMVGPQGWTTRINDQHEVEWIPPPGLDTGQTRINHYHQPEKLHPPPDDAWTPEPPADDEPLASDVAPAADESATAPDDARIPDGARASDESKTNGDNARVLNEPEVIDESTTNGDRTIKGDNATRQSGDPDPPDGKAA